MEIKIFGFERTTNQENILEFSCLPQLSAELIYQNVYLYAGEYKNLRYFISNTIGKSKHEWIKLLYELNIELKNNKFSFNKTIDQMIFRSFCVIFRPLHLDFIKIENEINIDCLKNEFHLDWTNKIGIQPSIYFLEENKYNKTDLEYLYKIQYLFKILLIYKTNSGEEMTFENYFVPFYIPPILISAFKNNSYNVWGKIKNDREEKIKHFVEK